MKNDDFGSDYLHAEDLLQGGKWGEFSLTIKNAHHAGTIKNKSGQTIEKPVLEFEQTEKRMVVGKTNSRLLKCEIGSSKLDDLPGQKITVYPALGDWFGQKNVVAIRVRVTGGKPKPFISLKDLGTDITGSGDGIVSKGVAAAEDRADG